MAQPADSDGPDRVLAESEALVARLPADMRVELTILLFVCRESGVFDRARRELIATHLRAAYPDERWNAPSLAAAFFHMRPDPSAFAGALEAARAFDPARRAALMDAVASLRGTRGSPEGFLRSARKRIEQALGHHPAGRTSDAM